MARPVWFVDLLKVIFRARYPLAKLTRLPLLGRLMDRALFKGDNAIYLPRERQIAVNQSIAAPEHTVLPSQVVEHFCERASHHWIMDKCACRDANLCQDYPIDLGCLFLGEAVLSINPALGRLVTKEEAIEHLRRCREAGLVHLIGKTKIDALWLGTKPMDKLLTICSCCPCCCLFGVLPELEPEISERYRRMPTVEVTVNDRCVGCGRCTEQVCFVNAIQVVDGKAQIGEDCRGYGLCVEVCPRQAIDLTYDPTLFYDAAVERIANLVEIT